MDNPCNHRQVFERYLYDYLIKKGMRETAEIFRRETDTGIDPLAPPEIDDVPDGFLREWWLINCDYFSEWERKSSQNKGSSHRDESNMWPSVPSPTRQHELNEQMIKELTFDNNFGEVLGGNLIHEVVPNPERLTVISPLANLDSTDTQELDSVVQAILRTTDVACNELSQSGGKRKKSGYLEDGSIDMPDGEGTSSSKNNTFEKSASFIEEKKNGEFSSKDEAFMLPCSLMAKIDDKGASPTKDDTIEAISSPVERQKDEEGVSDSRDGDMHDSSPHGNENEDDGVISSNLEHHESPNNDDPPGGAHHILDDMTKADLLIDCLQVIFIGLEENLGRCREVPTRTIVRCKSDNAIFIFSSYTPTRDFHDKTLSASSYLFIYHCRWKGEVHIRKSSPHQINISCIERACLVIPAASLIRVLRKMTWFEQFSSLQSPRLCVHYITHLKKV